MLFSTFTAALVFATSAFAAALPPPPPQPGKPHTYAPAKNLDKLASLFPKSNLTSPGDLALKYVVLGIGTQNYTCASPDESVTPGTTGAVATLYDIGTKLNDDRDANWKIGTLSPLALSMSEWAPQLLDMSLRSQGYQNIAGHHFFADVVGTNTPTFAFDQLTAPYPIAQVAKIGSVDAPKTACQGKNGLPAVAWLYLQHKAGISQGGINTVYRVETAGGNRPATCKGMPASWEVKYAAQYWVYGPKQ